MARIYDSPKTEDEFAFLALQVEFLKSEIERLTETIRELSSTQTDD